MSYPPIIFKWWLFEDSSGKSLFLVICDNSQNTFLQCLHSVIFPVTDIWFHYKFINCIALRWKKKQKSQWIHHSFEILQQKQYKSCFVKSHPMNLFCVIWRLLSEKLSLRLKMVSPSNINIIVIKWLLCYVTDWLVPKHIVTVTFISGWPTTVTLE